MGRNESAVTHDPYTLHSHRSRPLTSPEVKFLYQNGKRSPNLYFINVILLWVPAKNLADCKTKQNIIIYKKLQKEYIHSQDMNNHRKNFFQIIPPPWLYARSKRKILTTILNLELNLGTT